MTAALGVAAQKAAPRRRQPVFRSASIDEVAHDLRQAAAGSRIAVFAAAHGMDTSWTAIKLARALAENTASVLVGLGSTDAAIRAISTDPSAAGLAELAAGTASFGDIITKDGSRRSI